MKVLVTGGTGFVGGAFQARAAAAGQFSLRTALRNAGQRLPAGVEPVFVAGLTPTADWREAVTGCDAVLHVAARVHVMNDLAVDPLAEFRRVNVEGTLNLARQAAVAGVKRFVFISSIKVNGEGTPVAVPYAADDVPRPVDPYAISKCEAEQALHQLALETGMEVTIIRPPLVYGPGVKANLLNLLKAVDRGLPLPLASIANGRSLIYLDNLVDAISVAIKHPRAAGQTYLVSDCDDVSTPELIRRMATALGRSARLVPFPPALMRLAGRMLGKGAAVERLLESLVVDSGKIRRDLDWKPPYTMAEGLAATAKWYKDRMARRGHAEKN
jgi:nucleoside-diphosphate-sugar epimerase